MRELCRGRHGCLGRLKHFGGSSHPGAGLQSISSPRFAELVVQTKHNKTHRLGFDRSGQNRRRLSPQISRTEEDAAMRGRLLKALVAMALVVSLAIPLATWAGPPGGAAGR